jgi:hypothetical protein
VLSYKVKALSDKSVNFEEFGWDQDGHCVLVFELGTIVNVENALFVFRVVSVVVILFASIKFVNINAVCHCAIKFLCLQVVAVFLLFVLFNGKNVTEQPLEDLGVTVDGDVDLLIVGNLFEAAVEVLHVADE